MYAPRVVYLFAGVIALSAALLFVVQPMAARLVLPALGGSPGVWNTCLLFFQGALLLGYAYAHLIARKLPGRPGLAVHAAVLALGLGVLALGPPRGLAPSDHPVVWLLSVLATTVGPAFVALSATSPLLQSWFSRASQARSADPYFLSVASNIGSMLGLIAYPLVLEPALGLRGQWWAFVAVCLVAALGVSLAGLSSARGRAPSGPAVAASTPISWRRRAWWLFLSAAPAALLVSTTQHISTDIAAVPLLWVIPLAVYLLTFINAFARRWRISARAASFGLAIAAVSLGVAYLKDARDPFLILIALDVLVLALGGLVCHARLADDRPPPDRLTEFYFIMAVGGVVGTALCALLAPVVLEGLHEYPLAVIAACLARLARGPSDRDASAGASAKASAPSTGRARVLNVELALDLAWPALVFLVFVCADWLSVQVQAMAPSMKDGVQPLLLSLGLPILTVYIGQRRPVRFALGLGVVFIMANVADHTGLSRLHTDRTFFGVHRVVRMTYYDAQHTPHVFHQLVHGTTMHGLWSLDEARRREPLTYYHPTGPVGAVVESMRSRAAPLRVALVGMGSGAMAAYRRPEDAFTFFEIDPAVVRIAADPKLFGYLTDAGYPSPAMRVVIGDGRLALARDGGTYDLVVLDAFTSDAIPIHLLTKEAIQSYLDRLAPGGVIALHISNRYFGLAPVLAAAARDLGLLCRERADTGATLEQTRQGMSDSVWVVLARREADLTPLIRDVRWEPVPPADRAWTDDRSNVLDAFLWKSGLGVE